MWTKLADFIIKNRLLLIMMIVVVTVFMGYNARVKILYKYPDENMEELGSFFVEYSKILPQFNWESGDLNPTQKEFLELRAQSEVEKAIFESKTAAG